MKIEDASEEFEGEYTKHRDITEVIVIHHAGWKYAPGIAAVREVHAYHIRKWGTGVAYHECLVREADGSIKCYKTSDPSLVRYGVAYENHRSFHISALTNFANTIPAQDWLDAFANRVAAAQARYPNARVVGHKEIAHAGWETTCPGTRWQEWKPVILGGLRVDMWQTPHWYRVPVKIMAVVRYEPEVRGDRNMAAVLSPGSRVHIKAWHGEWGELSGGGWVHKSGVQPE